MNSIRIHGAEEHNLKGLSLDVPRDTLTVFTGVSGSGKSSLAFDTIYKEGRRRFLESLSPYARRFLGGFEKPNVARIEGLSPAISIEQKTIGHSPRSTVGTVTEAHDHLRLLYARLGLPHCHICKRPVRSQSAEQVVDQLLHRFAGRRVLLCAPIVRGRRGEFRKELETLRRDGYLRVRIDGEIHRLDDGALELERRREHTIEVVYDRQHVSAEARARLVEDVEKCFELGHGTVNVVLAERRAPGKDRDGNGETGADEQEHLFSGRFACPTCGVDLPELEPRLFSFNSPHGACGTCRGLGETSRIDPSLLVADPSLPFRKGGLAVIDRRGRWIHEGLDPAGFEALGKRLGFSSSSSWGDLSEEARRTVIEGGDDYRGLASLVDEIRADEPAFLEDLARELPCPACRGERLSPLARAVTFEGYRLPELCALPIDRLREVLGTIELTGAAAAVGEPILRELSLRLRFLDEVGLPYLSLARASRTLSGGEAQRVRLASQVGAGLRGVVYVLDEPSIGLHSRDQRRLLRTLRRLRDAGNTVLVVEHDRETIETADHLIDLGPGAGARGGELVAQGTIDDLAGEPRSLTGAYLSGRMRIEVPERRRRPQGKWLELLGVRRNNLKDIDVRIPLGVLVAVTGVSGSGKSSLVSEVLRPALLAKLRRRPAPSGDYRSLRGHQQIDKLIDIDQSPIGKTPRSNPATYTKVFDKIRDLFARLPESRARGYKPGRFSFNVEGGRCLECRGGGVILVDMQFLAPVEVLCDACGGRRYNRETLEVLYRGRNISEVLDLTVSEALAFFRDIPAIRRPLGALEDVGLGYVRLGQPSTTLSGGEAQRLKLASELLKRDTGRTLYILDEPTTGLHFEDIRALLKTVQELVDRKNTVLVIEHNLEVLKTADYLIDLGPEGGEAGGEVVASGSPEEVMACDRSHTGRALREVLEERGTGAERAGRERAPDRRDEPAAPADVLRVEGATIHNLRSVDLDIPLGKMTVITGVSGSGKTSLAFDTIFAEGQRRYMDSLSTYARHFLGRLQSPPVRNIHGLSPAIAIDQKSVSSSRRSTVATITEIHDYLRLLYARAGRPHCPSCGERLRSTTPTRLAAELVRSRAGERLHALAPLSLAAREEEAVRSEILRLLKAGFTRVMVSGEEIRLDEGDPSTPLRRVLGALRQSGEEGAEEGNGSFVVVDRVVLGERSQSRLADSLEQAFERGGGTAAVRVQEDPPELYTRTPSCPRGHFSFEGELTPRMFSFNSVEGACTGCRGTGIEKRVEPERMFTRRSRPVLEALEPRLRAFLESYRTSSLQLLGALLATLKVPEDRPYCDLSPGERRALLEGEGIETVAVGLQGGSYDARWPGLVPLLESWVREDEWIAGRFGLDRLFRRRRCSRCGGERLRPEVLAVRVGDLGIHELTALTIEDARRFFGELRLEGREAEIAREVLEEVTSRLRFLDDVGLGYIALDRTSATLSGGEAQRIRLASQLGNRLVGVLYVLDEPTVGLHPKDTQRLLASLRELRDQGNTILMVEHDRETIEAADWVVDMGPEAGERGGRVIATGAPAEIAARDESVTGRYLRGDREPSRRRDRRPPGDRQLVLEGVRCHNLIDVDVSVPLGVFNVVTGVSGSGKSTLVLDVIAHVVEQRLERRGIDPSLARRVEGTDGIRRVVVVDQRPIGRTPKSTPATYTGLWTHVRDLFASLPLSKARGYGPGRFSFNAIEGRCFACSGQGARLVEMHFLSDVWVECEVCGGRRFNEATLDVRFKGRTVSDVLGLEVDRAAELFENQPKIIRVLRTLQELGLGYIRLGQSAATLSGGEAQRVKLAAELLERPEGGNLYILDEPTTGLHFADIERLLDTLQRLVEGKNTLVVIEHQLDVIAAADWVIDMGPGAGSAGGRIVATGPPEEVARREESHTGRFLRKMGVS